MRLLPILLLAFIPFTGSAEGLPRQYEPQHRAAADLLPQAEAVLTPQGGRAVLDAARNALLLVGEDAAVETALDVLRAADVAPRMVTLRHEAVRKTDLDRRGVGVEWSIAEGRVRVGNVRRAPNATRVAVRAARGRERTSDSTTSTIRVLEGGWARIASGATVPLRTGGIHGPAVILVRAETGVEARPTLLRDGMIQLELMPFTGEVTPEGGISGSSGSTTVRVRPGETIVLGGFDRELSERSSGTSGRTTARGTEDLLLLVTADLAAQ